MVDPMLKLQTKEHSPSKKKKPSVGKKASIIDLNLSSSNLNITQKQEKSGKKKSKNNVGSRLPNMDLIEDVSAASQILNHELLNTNTGFMPSVDDNHSADQQIAVDQPNLPLDPPLDVITAQHTAVGFHRGGYPVDEFTVNDPQVVP